MTVKRRLLFTSAGVIALLVAMFALGDLPAAWADTSSMDWDVAMTDTGPTANDPVCPSNMDDKIDVGECPEISSNLFIDTKDPTSNEAFLDLMVRFPDKAFLGLATQVWKTGPPGADLDGDTLPEPQTGVAQLSNLTHATTVGNITLSIENNLVLQNLLVNNIDDVTGSYDVTVTGQPPVCGANQPGPTGTFAVAFDVWSATTNYAYLVRSNAAQPNNYTVGQDCMLGGGTPDPYGIPDGVDCTPDVIPFIQAAIGLPFGNYVARGFGIANLPIGSPPIMYQARDVNVLVYNMVSVPEVQGYVQLTMIERPLGNPAAAGFSPLDQTVTVCPPYFSSPMASYGITQDSAFPNPPGFKPTLREIHLRVVGGPSDTFGFNIYKSVGEDWDGDTIASHYDRCAFDPSSGTAAQDIDGDTLTGLCETLSGPGIYTNGEGTNPEDTVPAGWNTAPPWDSGQDVDGDGYLNEVDNCPIVPDQDLNSDTIVDYQQDTDNDGIGDVCEIDLAPILGWVPNAYLIPGNGSGYPGRQAGDMHPVASPGTFADRDNVCSDPFTVNTVEPTLDSGRWCAGSDRVGRPYGPSASGISALGREFADSNDNAMPDLLDYPASAPTPGPPIQWTGIEWMDVNSDTDMDGHTDACEAFMGSDPLDASSLPVYASVTPPAGDCDSDGTPDASDSDPFTGLDPDADKDGCTRSQEQPGAAVPAPGSTAAGGVSFQDQAWYDFYDVPVPANSDPTPNGSKNKTVSMGDVVAVLFYIGTSNNGPPNGNGVDYDSDKNGDTVKDGVDYDRSPSAAPNPPRDAGPPNGAVSMQDVIAVLLQVGLDCGALPGPTPTGGPNGMAVDAIPSTADVIDTETTQALALPFQVSVNVTAASTAYAGYDLLLEYDDTKLAFVPTSSTGWDYTQLLGGAGATATQVGARLQGGAFATSLGGTTATGQAVLATFQCIALGTSTIHLVTQSDSPGVWTSTLAPSGLPIVTPLTDVSVTCAELSDIRVTKTDSADPVEPGATFTYTIVAENVGPNAARGLVVADALPDPADGDGRGHKDFVQAAVDIDADGDTSPEIVGTPCSPGFVGLFPNPLPPPPPVFNSVVICSISPTLVPSLPPGGRAFVRITVSAPPEEEEGTVNVNLAIAGLVSWYGEPDPSVDPDPSNEADCAGLVDTPDNVGCERTQVGEPTPTPTPTDTATPTPTATDTPTATATATPTPAPNELAVDANPSDPDVDPSLLQGVNAIFDVSANVTKAGLAYNSYQAKVQFNPAVLEFQWVDPKGVQYKGLGGMTLDADAVVGADNVFAGSALESGETNATGQAHLLRFKCVGEGTSPLHLMTLDEEPIFGSTTIAPLGDTIPTGLKDAEVTCASIVDTDGDGCVNQEEAAGASPPKPGATGAYDPNDPYDFYDVPVPVRPDPAPSGPRNRGINLQDVVAVLAYVGTSDGGAPNPKGVDYDSDKGIDTNGDTVAEIPPDDVPDGRSYDRSPGPLPSPPFDAGPPDGAVNLQDVVVVLKQVGLDCSGPP